MFSRNERNDELIQILVIQHAENAESNSHKYIRFICNYFVLISACLTQFKI